MPDSNDPLETALRNIRRAIIDDTCERPTAQTMHLIRTELVNFHKREKALDDQLWRLRVQVPTDHGEQ
jgi:hypothetical protein